MSADKPLQDIFNTVRIPVTDSVVSVTANGYSENTGGVGTYNGVDYGFYHNCYPNFFSDRASNQYSSQFDTWLEKRHPCVGLFTNPISNATLPTANGTTATNSLVVTNLDDVYVFSIFDSTANLHRIIQYRPAANTSLQIGTIAGTVTDTIFLAETIIAGVATLIVTYTNAAESASTGAYATSAGGVFTAASLTVIADVDYPANIAGKVTRGNVVCQDGWTYIMTKQGGVYNSELNSITSWNALGVVQAQAYPDQGVGLVRYKNHIVAVGEDSIEFFNNTGTGGTPTNPKSPLQRTDQAFIKFGAMTAKGVYAIDDTFYWWAKSSTNKWGMYRLDGYTPVKVSTVREDYMAAKVTTFPEIYSMNDNGKQHLITNIPCYGALMFNAANTNATGGGTPSIREGQPSAANFPSDPNSLVAGDLNNAWLSYDILTGCFWGWAHASNNVAFPLFAMNYSPTTANIAITANIIVYSYGPPRTVNGPAGWANVVHSSYTETSGGNSGGISYTDAATTGGSNTFVTAGLQFNNWDFGNEKRKRIHKLKVLLRSIPPSSQEGTTYPYIWVVYNKTNGEMSGFTTAQDNVTKIFKRAIKRTPGVYRYYLNNLGAARQWYFAIFEKSGFPFMCKGIELDISQGTA